MFVVERGMEGFERGKQIEKLGQHASDTAELFFNDCRVPAENLLGEEGTGFVQLDGAAVPERLALAVSSMAGCEAALAMTLEYVKERKAFGRPIGSFQNSRFVLAELQTKVEITRCFDRPHDRALRRGHLHRPGGRDGQVLDDRPARPRSPTPASSSTAATATRPSTRSAEAWVDARVNRIYAGTNEIMKELIGRTMGL